MDSISEAKMNQVVSRNFLSYLPLKVGFPFAGVLTDCSFGNVKAQEHNISCIVETLGSEYLHVDLSHISPTWFVGGDPVTVFNLFEIMDGLLDFMLEQIDIEADSGGIFLLKPNYIVELMLFELLLCGESVLRYRAHGFSLKTYLEYQYCIWNERPGGSNPSKYQF